MSKEGVYLNLKYFEVFTKGNNGLGNQQKADRKDPFKSPLIMD